MEINTVHGFAEEEAAPGATVVISLGITLLWRGLSSRRESVYSRQGDRSFIKAAFL